MQERDEERIYKPDTEAPCALKTQDFGARHKLRAEELEVIKKAIEIISSGAVAGPGEQLKFRSPRGIYNEDGAH